jgi:hypothetical protein
MKSEHVSDWFCVTSGWLKFQAWRCIQSALRPFRSSLTTKGWKSWQVNTRYEWFFDWRKSGYPLKKFQRIEDKNWSHIMIFSYWTHHQPCDISEEGSHIWRWSNYSIKNSWSAWFEWSRPIGDFQSTGSPIGNRNSPGLMTCSGASDDTSIFTQARGPLNIKDEAGRSTHKEVGPKK